MSFKIIYKNEISFVDFVLNALITWGILQKAKQHAPK